MTDQSAPMTNSEDDAPQNRQIEFRDADQTPLLYANSVQLRTSIYDITLQFGQVVEATEERLVVKTVAQFAMSPQHARVLSDLLVEKLRNYEERFGTIPRIE